MLELKTLNPESIIDVSVAGCLGYDVLGSVTRIR